MKFTQKINDLTTPQILKVIRLGNPQFNKLSETADIQCTPGSNNLSILLKSLKMTAAKFGYVSLSATQVGLRKNLFIMRHQLNYNQWVYDYSSVDDYEVFLNPVIESTSQLMESQWEECPSFPFQIYKVQRSEAIRVRYQNENFTDKREELHDFKARVFQHEIDHLNGRVLESHEVCSGVFKESSRIYDIVNKGKLDLVQEELEYTQEFGRRIQFSEHIHEQINKHKQTGPRILDKTK